MTPYKFFEVGEYSIETYIRLDGTYYFQAYKKLGLGLIFVKDGYTSEESINTILDSIRS